MGYRGDDGARERAAWGAQSPRQSSGEHAEYDRPGYDGPGHGSAGYDESAYTGTSYDAYGQGDSYGQGDTYGQRDGYGPASHDGSGRDSAGRDSGSYATGGYGGGQVPAGGYDTGTSYGTDSYSSRGYQSGASYGTGGYPAGDYGSDDHGSLPHGNGPASYESGAYGSGAYQSAPYDSSYDSSPRGADSYNGADSYGGAGSSYGSPSSTSGGYPTIGHPSGGYPAQGDDAYSDGNDWYGRSGPQPTGLADTSAHLVVRDPVRGYPPEPARADDGLGYTGQQARYDESEHVTYPGYAGVDDEHGQAPRRGYEYDDYADYGTVAGNQRDQRLPGQQEFETRLDQVAVDYDAMDLGARDYNARRGYGQALQGDDFDGGRHRDDYPGTGADVLAIPGTGGRRGQAGDPGQDGRDPSGPIAPAPNAPRSIGAGKNGAPKRRRRGLMYATVAGLVALVAVAAVGGYKYTHPGQDSAAREANQPLPSSTASVTTQECAAQSGEQFCHIELRTDDPAPLTLSELYLTAFHSQKANADFLLQTDKVDTNCANAIFGSQLISQVKTGKCTQVLRATYLSGDKTIMGTIGVVNLSSTNQAHYAGKIVGQNDFIQPLKTSKGLTAKIGQGVGVVEAEYKGHYLILTWAEFTNLKTPATAAQTQQLENWENALVNGSANIYLSQRMINGDTSSTVPSGSPGASGSTSPSAKTSATS
ncbi:MAG: hypothetical protein JWM19_7718 [Actinomycetia bacterium]|nr:hypothetical protein [Actinomycetes bacterium]